MSRKCKELLFCGAGEFSAQKVKMLHNRLDEAISILSGIQQGGKPCVEQDEAAIKDIVQDLSVALLGREIFLWDKELPYPQTDNID
jgi:hypothetical protein